MGGCRRRFEAVREREEMKNIKLKIGSSGFPVKMFFTTKDTKSLAWQSRNQNDRLVSLV